MTVQLKHGVMLTNFRRKIVRDYKARHAWVDWYKVTWVSTHWWKFRKWENNFAKALAGRQDSTPLPAHSRNTKALGETPR